MLAGTGSDVGKSVLATALCRIFRQDGYAPAPFKAQNMALNSYCTPDGLEIGRAQAVQAEAAGIPCSADMNPLLLKPNGDRTSQVVLNGKPFADMQAYDYFRNDANRDFLRQQVRQAYGRLAQQFNPIVMEGAGSISELNLRDTDLVNMPMARWAGADVILVGDIDRGGVFASLYGSIMLQEPADRKRIKGVIVNKFRGDIRLFESGVRQLEAVCQVPVLGVVPYFTDIQIEAEDSVCLAQKSTHWRENALNVAVAAAQHLSNFTDFDTLSRLPQVHVYFTAEPEELAHADIIVLPGSKTVVSDLAALRQSGAADAIRQASERGATVLGICGGYQMMGEEILDPERVESDAARTEGLGLLPVSTTLRREKRTRQVHFSLENGTGEGYEIHHGETRLRGGRPLCTLHDGSSDGCAVSDRCMGTYIHGILDNACALQMLLGPRGVAVPDPLPLGGRAFKEAQYDRLAALVRAHIDMEKLYEILSES